MLRRLLLDDSGQDLVEYALLVAFVGLTALAAWLAIQDSLGAAYGRVDLRQQDLSAGPGGSRNGPLVTPEP